jgi:hypothetical protein
MKQTKAQKKSQQKYRKLHPFKYAYTTLKCNAKRRGKEFTLTLYEFICFCHETNYIGYKGKKGTCLSIDRIDQNKGYTFDNIQPLSLSENTKKQRMHEQLNDCPF